MQAIVYKNCYLGPNQVILDKKATEFDDYVSFTTSELVINVTQLSDSMQNRIQVSSSNVSDNNFYRFDRL